MKQTILKIKNKNGNKEIDTIEIDAVYRISKMDVDYFAVCVTRTNAYVCIEDVERISGLCLKKCNDADAEDGRVFASINTIKKSMLKNKQQQNHDIIGIIENKISELKNKYKNT